MNFLIKAKNYLEKLRNLPDENKKTILWTIVAITGVVMVFIWIGSIMNGIEKIGKETNGVQLPKIEMPAVPALDSLKIMSDSLNSAGVNGEKLYKNVKYGFEVKYPENWSFREYDSGAAFFLTEKAADNTTGNGAINLGFYKRGADYCKIPFADYVKTAGPMEIQNFESVNQLEEGTNGNGLKGYVIQWNYKDMQGVEKVSLPITYFEGNSDSCGSFEIFLNDENYSDIYKKVISSFNFIK